MNQGGGAIRGEKLHLADVGVSLGQLVVIVGEGEKLLRGDLARKKSQDSRRPRFGIDLRQPII